MTGRGVVLCLWVGLLIVLETACEGRDSPTAPAATSTLTATATPTEAATSTPTPTGTPRPFCYPLDVSGEWDAEWTLEDCRRSGGPVRVLLTQVDCRVRGVIPGLGTLTAVLFGTLPSRSGYGITLEEFCEGSAGGFGFDPRLDPIVLHFASVPVLPFPSATCPGCEARGTLTLRRRR